MNFDYSILTTQYMSILTMVREVIINISPSAYVMIAIYMVIKIALKVFTAMSLGVNETMDNHIKRWWE